MSIKADAEVLRRAFKAVATQAETVRVLPDEEGWRVYARGLDNVSVADVRLGRGCFAEGDDGYEVWEPFTVDCRDVLEPLAKAKGHAEMDISTGRLVVRTGAFTFTRALRGDMDVKPKFAELEYTAECIAQMSSLTPLIQATSGDVRRLEVRLAQTEGSIVMDVHGGEGDIDAVSMTLETDDCLLLEGAAEASFSAEKVFDIWKAIPQDAEADMQFSTDYPLQVSYSTGDATMRFMVAPRVEVQR